MKFRLATWNINSVRLRIPLIEQFVDIHAPDILCLQETKCANDDFPLKRLKKLGFQYIEINGQKGYHGVATLARQPINIFDSHDFNGTGESRHLAVTLENISDNEAPLILHNFYVPAGGDEPNVDKNPKFRQKLDFLQGMEKKFKKQKNKSRQRMILVGDLNVAPLENDVWSHKQLLNVVSHTPVEVEHLNRLQHAHDWIDVMRAHVPADEKLYTWWSYRAKNWRVSNRGRRLDHIWITPALDGAVKHINVIDEARDWEKPSDHVPVIADFELPD